MFIYKTTLSINKTETVGEKPLLKQVGVVKVLFRKNRDNWRVPIETGQTIQ